MCTIDGTGGVRSDNTRERIVVDVVVVSGRERTCSLRLDVVVNDVLDVLVVLHEILKVLGANEENLRVVRSA